jgi:transcriptional regulator with XRE-family HTH domain
MLIGQRLRQLREAKHLSQGVIEKRTGLLRCYTSRVENGHTVPTVETLEKYARALEVPFYKLFLEGDELPEKPKLPAVQKYAMWGAGGKEGSELRSFAKALGRMKENERKLLLALAHQMAKRKRKDSGGSR